MTGKDIQDIPSTHQYEEANSGTGHNPTQPSEQAKNESGTDDGTNIYGGNQNDTKETAALAVNTDNEQNIDSRQTGTKVVDEKDTDTKAPMKKYRYQTRQRNAKIKPKGLSKASTQRAPVFVSRSVARVAFTGCKPQKALPTRVSHWNLLTPTTITTRRLL